MILGFRSFVYRFPQKIELAFVDCKLVLRIKETKKDFVFMRTFHTKRVCTCKNMRRLGSGIYFLVAARDAEPLPVTIMHVRHPIAPVTLRH